MRSRGPWGQPERLRKIQRQGHFRKEHAPPCSNCGKLLDGWTALEPGTRPEPSVPGHSSISICMECGTLHEFVGYPKRLKLRPLEGDELILALADPKIRKARGLILMAAALRPREK